MFFGELLKNIKMYEEENKITRDSTIQPEQLLTFWSIFPFCFSLYSLILIFLHIWHHTICSCTSAKAPFWAAEADSF